MPSLFDVGREKSKAPQYYVWSHPQSPYVVELRLDIIDRLMTDLRAAQSIRLETGGLLVGTFVRAANPTLRIEDYELIGRGAEDGLLYNLTTEQKTRFAAVRHKFISKQIRVLGFFRSQIRGGPLALSAEDRDLLSSEFRRAIHIALLIRMSARPTAGFLVPSATGEIQTEPAWNQVPFETEELARLSEVQRQAPAWNGSLGRSEAPDPLPSQIAAYETQASLVAGAAQTREFGKATQFPTAPVAPTRSHLAAIPRPPTPTRFTPAPPPTATPALAPNTPALAPTALGWTHALTPRSPTPPAATPPPATPPAPAPPGATAADPRTQRPGGFRTELSDRLSHQNVAALVTGAALFLTLSFTVWGSLTADLLSSSNRLDLTAAEKGDISQLEWNHDMAQLRKADSALLTIQDGADKHEMTLSPAELKAGSIAYRRHSSTVVFTMVLNLPDSMSLVQSVTVVAGPQQKNHM